jgi:hypothetical protein
MNDDLFPTIKRSITNLIEDEEGNIPAGKLLTIGTLVVIFSSILNIDALSAYGAHASHSSHSSHASHSSTSYIRNHDNLSSHTNHASHASHSSHTSHSNTASHSNSNYSAAGDYNTPKAPTSTSISGVKTPILSSSTTVQIPAINATIASPESTPVIGAAPALAVPLDTPQTNISTPVIQEIPDTPVVKEMSAAESTESK